MRPSLRTIVGSLVALVAATTPLFAFAAASLSFSPSSGSFSVGKTFTVQVMADSVDPFNSGNATIAFDKEALAVQSVSKTSSAFSLWAVEPSFSNSQGTVSFEGGNTSAISGKKQLVAISFKALKEGKTDLSFTVASILAADGKGTDIAGTKGTASFDIGGASPQNNDPPPQDSTQSSGGVLIPKPDEPQISSTSHPEETKWYNASKAKFVWDLPADVTVVRLALDKSSTTVPTTNYDPAISDKEFDNLENGVMYFHLRYKNDGGVGPTAHRKIMVDKDPPLSFTLEAVDPKESGSVVLKFMASDTLSGIDHYEASLDGGAPLKIQPNEVKESGYELTQQTPGDHTVTIKAFDKAGNSSEAQGKFLIPGQIAKANAAAGDAEPKPTDWKLIGLIVTIAILGFVVGYMVYERSSFRHEKYVTKREADEIRDSVSNIFSALRDEIGEQAGLLFQQPNPSALDREVLMRMNEALDLSEELIAKEVEDVRKLLM